MLIKMKKSLICTIMLATALLMCACAMGARDVSPTGPVATGTSTPAVSAAQEDTTLTPAPTSTPTATPTPTPTQTPHDRVISTLESTDEKGIYALGDPEDEVSWQACFVLDGNIIIYCSYTDEDGYTNYELRSYDKDTYELVNIIDDPFLFDGLEEAEVIKVGTRRIAVRPPESCDVMIYDGELGLIYSFEVPSLYTCLAFDDANERLYYFEDDKYLLCRDYGRNELYEVMELDYNDFSCADLLPADSNTLLAAYYLWDYDESEQGTFVIDLEKAEITDNLERSVRNYSRSPKDGRTLTGSCYPDYALELWDEDGNLVKKIRTEHYLEESIFFADWDNDMVITCISVGRVTDMVMELRCYSMETGEIVSDCAVRMTGYEFDKCDLDPEAHVIYFVSESNDTGIYECGRLCVWDYLNDDIQDKTGVFKRTTAVTETFSDRTEELRNLLQDAYGINIYMGYEIIDADFGYDLEVIRDDGYLYPALLGIKEVMETYPDGFFEQMKTGNIRSLGLYLCGDITGSGSGVSSAIGLATNIGYERSLALDANYGYFGGIETFKMTIYHEFSHWIDDHIYYAVENGDMENYREGFALLNPEDYYAESYTDYYYRVEYTYFYEDDMSRVFSIDNYSRTFDGEDRARLFEYLFYSEDSSEYYSGNYEYYRCKHLLIKCKYYFDAIREAFDDTDWPEKTVWEQKLDEQIEKYEEYYGEPYDAEPEESEPAA